jgi:hypothetical protein
MTVTAKKQIGLGTIFKTDIALAATYVAQHLVREVTPPGRAREQVDGVDLSDVLDVALLGIESRSQFTVTQFWHPGDTNHQQIDTAFGSRVEFGAQIVTSHATPKTLAFTAQVVAIAPQTLSANGTYQREVTFQRTSAITVT